MVISFSSDSTGNPHARLVFLATSEGHVADHKTDYRAAKILEAK